MQENNKEPKSEQEPRGELRHHEQGADASKERGYRRQQMWEANLRLIEDFIHDFGRLPRLNGKNRSPLERHLGIWVRTQRRERERRSKHQIHLLEQLPGFEWDQRDASWEKRLNHYRSFRSQHGREPSVRSGDAFERRLAVWVARQRSTRRRGMLPKLRADLLDQLDQGD